LRLRGVVEQSKAFLGELVDAVRISATQHAPAVAAQLAVPKIIYVEKHDVRPICHLTPPGSNYRMRTWTKFSYRCSSRRTDSADPSTPVEAAVVGNRRACSAQVVRS
jgi:hypothetical protein